MMWLQRSVWDNNTSLKTYVALKRLSKYAQRHLAVGTNNMQYQVSCAPSYIFVIKGKFCTFLIWSANDYGVQETLECL